MGLLDSTSQKSYYQGNDYGNYQFTSLEDIINQFMVAYVGEEKIISKARRIDVAFHAQRALRELSFDTFKSIKSQEIELPPSLTMRLPHDYVNYTKLSWSDSAGIGHIIYPTSKTSNPFKIIQDDEKEYDFGAANDIVSESDFSNADFATALSAQDDWSKTPASTTDPDGNSIADALDSITTANTLTSTTLPFYYPAGQTTTFTGRAYAVWQQINVENLDYLTIGATGSSAAAEAGKSDAGTIRIGISTNPGHSTTNLAKPTNPSTNDQLNVGDLDANSDGGPNFLPDENGALVAEWNDGTSSYKTLDRIDVRNSASFLEPNVVYVLITSYTNFLDVTAAASTNTLTGVTVGENILLEFEGSSTSLIGDTESTTWTNYKSHTPSENNNDDYEDDTYWPWHGERYGLEPQHAQINGSFFIDDLKGKIHFSSNISGKTVILDYISDSLGTDGEMQVHKFAEDAMYKWIAHAILSTKSNIPEYVVRRYQKDKFAATRQAKLRLSNVKLEELTQILRGKSKHIKH